MKVPKEVLDKAHQILKAIKLNQFPDDDWIGLADIDGQEFDLNLYLDMDEHPAATIYPVFEGMTDVTQFHSLKFRLGV